MNIKELLDAAKTTHVTTEQINKLRARLQKQSANPNPNNPSKEFLERTYKI